jgi:hypothetical protein
MVLGNQRILVECYYVRLIGVACWQAEDGLDVERFFLALAQSVLPMVDP